MRNVSALKWIIVGLLLLPIGVQATDDILYFREWKAQRIYEAELTVERTRRELKRPKSALEEGTTETVGRVQARTSPRVGESLADAQRALKAAKELTATDYFHLYLRLLPSDQIRKMSEKLSKKELAEILASIRVAPSELAEANSQNL